MYLCKIHKLQKWAMRVISNSHYRSHTVSIFQKYNILNVYDSYKLEVGVFMYQYFQNLLPSSFNTFFSKCSDIHDYHTRNRSNFNQTRNKKKFAAKTIRTTGPTTWNSIGDKIKKAISTNHFQKSFKSLLIDNDINEYYQSLHFNIDPFSFLILNVTGLLIFGMFSELVFVVCENYVFS